jgi:hypothetical protein
MSGSATGNVRLKSVVPIVAIAFMAAKQPSSSLAECLVAPPFKGNLMRPTFMEW